MFWILALGLAAVTAAWLRYRWVHRPVTHPDEIPGLSDRPGPRPWGMHSHQSGAQWLHQIFERSAAKYPDFPALTVAASGETLTYQELDQRAGEISALITPMLDQADQVVAIYMTQDHADAVASHLAILK
ncbi:MAG: AMP-binding protein, partial [Arenicellales bacterium]